MTWVKLDTKFLRHPKVAPLRPLEVVLYVAGLLHAGDFKSDGWIPEGALRGLIPGTKRPQKVAQVLVEAGLWERVEGGWRIHDYADYQRTSDQITGSEDNGASRGRGRAHSRGRARAQTRAPEDVDVDRELPPRPPVGGRTRDRISYEGKLAEFSATHFPGVDAGYVAHYASVLRAHYEDPTVDALRPLLEPHREPLL